MAAFRASGLSQQQFCLQQGRRFHWPEAGCPTLALGGDSDAERRGNWIPTTWLDQYGATLAQWFGVSNLLGVFPNLSNFNPSTYNLGFV